MYAISDSEMQSQATTISELILKHILAIRTAIHNYRSCGSAETEPSTVHWRSSTQSSFEMQYEFLPALQPSPPETQLI